MTTREEYDTLAQERLDLLAKRGKPADYPQDEFKAMGLRLAELNALLAKLKQEFGITPADVRAAHRQRKKGDNNTYVGTYTPEYIAQCQNSDIYMWKHKILRERLLQQYYRTEGVKRGFAKGVIAFEEKYNVNVIGKKEDEKILDFLSNFDNLLDVPVRIRTKDGKLIWESENGSKQDDV